MIHPALLPFSSAVACLAIGLIVVRRGTDQPMHRAFAWMALCCAAWNLDIAALDFLSEPTAAERWSRLLRIGICFGPATMLHMALVIRGDTLTRRWRRWLVGGYAIGTALSVLNLRGKLVAGLSRHTWGWYIEPAPAYSLFTFTFLIFGVLFVERVFGAYRHPTSPRQRTVAKFWLLGGGLQLVLAITNFLPIYGINAYPLGSLGTALWLPLLGYAIARHRVMDLDYAVRKGVSFALALVCVVAPGTLGLTALVSLLDARVPALLAVAAGAVVVLAALLTPRLQVAFETRLHQALFPSRYDYRRRLRHLAAQLVNVIEESKLVHLLGTTLAEVLEVDGVEIFVRHDAARRPVQVFPPVPDAEPLSEESAAALGRLTGPTLVDELPRGPALALFRSRGWEVGVPLRIAERLVGFAGLGPNHDFQLMSGEDLDLLGDVAAGSSAALEHMRLARQLRRSEQELEHASRLSSLGMLAAGLAHEIRNPLVAVKTFLDLLPHRLEDREFLTSFRDLSLSELRRVTDLLSDLLALGKSSTAERRAIDLAQTVEPVLRLMDSTARKRQVTLVVRNRPDLPPVWADPDQLKQITLNLVLNAIEVSPSQSAVTVDLRPGAWGGVLLEVRDQGSGIPSDQVEKIFNPFFTTKEAGTGLGLALTHQMVVEHGGEITVESVEGRGTVFRVLLPVAQTGLQETGS
ncbi:MAG: ATP-binding protein [Candidatus Binatia bacterium]